VLDLKFAQRGHLRLVVAKGSIDNDTAEAMEEMVRAAMDRDDVHLVIDLAEVFYISSAGLRVILRAKEELEAGGVYVVNAKAMVKKLLTVTGVGKHLVTLSKCAPTQLDDYLECLCERFGSGA